MTTNHSKVNYINSNESDNESDNESNMFNDNESNILNDYESEYQSDDESDYENDYEKNNEGDTNKYKYIYSPYKKPYCKNLMLINEYYMNYNFNNTKTLYDIVNSETLPFIYNKTTLRSDLKKVINENPTLERMCIIDHNAFINNKVFIENETFFSEQDLSSNTYSNNLKFILNELSNIKQIDFLIDNSHEHSSWLSYYNLLIKNCNYKINILDKPLCLLRPIKINNDTDNHESFKNIYLDLTCENDTDNNNYETMLFIDTVEITSNTSARVSINGKSPEIVSIEDYTYVLDFAVINSGVQLKNSTDAVVFIKLKNTNTYTKKPILIDGSNITIDGENQNLDLKNVNDFGGLVHIGDNCKQIKIKNITIEINSYSSLSEYAGWICHGELNNTQIEFRNCIIHSKDNININNIKSGGICGGNNILSIAVTLAFNNCQIISLNSINIYKKSGGICGSNNGDNISFTDCTVYSTNTITIQYYSGGICGGHNNNPNLIFIMCKVISEIGNINLFDYTYKKDDFGAVGGICGGSNNNGFGSLNFTDCKVIAITGHISIHGEYYSGGICGGYNGSECIGNGSSVLSFTSCSLIARETIDIDGTATGGICGGYNGSENSNDGSTTITFTHCHVMTKMGDINIYIGNYSGGICGGFNGGGYNGNINSGLSTLTFTDCSIEASIGDITMSGNDGGGICGGYNSCNNSFGSSTIIFIKCFLYWYLSFNTNTQYPEVKNFYNLLERNDKELIFIGNYNLTTAQIKIDSESGVLKLVDKQNETPEDINIKYKNFVEEIQNKLYGNDTFKLGGENQLNLGSRIPSLWNQVLNKLSKNKNKNKNDDDDDTKLKIPNLQKKLKSILSSEKVNYETNNLKFNIGEVKNHLTKNIKQHENKEEDREPDIPSKIPQLRKEQVMQLNERGNDKALDRKIFSRTPAFNIKCGSHNSSDYTKFLKVKSFDSTNIKKSLSGLNNETKSVDKNKIFRSTRGTNKTQRRTVVTGIVKSKSKTIAKKMYDIKK